jgi:hypothetical protein
MRACSEESKSGNFFPTKRKKKTEEGELEIRAYITEIQSFLDILRRIVTRNSLQNAGIDAEVHT